MFYIKDAINDADNLFDDIFLLPYHHWKYFSNILVFWLLILFYVTDLVSQNIEVILNRKTNMEAVIKIIEENIPEVKWIQRIFLMFAGK